MSDRLTLLPEIDTHAEPTALTRDQEIRARAIELAADLLDLPPETTVAQAYVVLTTLAKPIAAYIRDGSHATEGETR